MKDRIMHYLDAFVKGEADELATELQVELGLDAQTFQNQAREVQASILHQYTNFSISTIDAFFQKVIRSFTREAGILGDYRLEVDQDLVMEEVIGNLIDELGTDDQLTEWLVEYALDNLEADRTWDMRKGLMGFSKEIFREEFKAVEKSFEQAAHNKDYFRATLKLLQKKKNEFVGFVNQRAKQVLNDFHSMGLKVDDFKYKSMGSAYTLFVKFSKLYSVNGFDEGKRARSEFQFAKNWPDKNHLKTNEIIRLAETKWIGTLNEILEYHIKNYETCLSAEVALNNFYAFGLLTDISRKLAEYKRDNNVLLLADAPQFLNGIIHDSDTPFIYEKVGSFYRNFLIDEFQDTSGLQWKNFQPLLTNGLDSGYPSMIVGDVKQAVYRWRGGNLSLLQSQIEDEIGPARTEVNLLNKNFRSANEIVSFNNSFFKSASKILSDEIGLPLSSSEYSDVLQVATKLDRGFVALKFVGDEGKSRWEDEALRQTVLRIEELQRKGARPSEIALLVRKNEEGQKIISYLLAHKNSSEAQNNMSYDVVSSESLRIDTAGSVNLLVAALTYLLNPDDAIARAQLAYENARQHDEKKTMSEVFAVSNTVLFENQLPTAFAGKKIALRKLPLFELTETLIELFELGKTVGELPYLLAFQDFVLEFASRERNDLRAFLGWWAENKHKKSIVAPVGAEAMQLFTVHRAKGLQFKYVIVPFCSWGLDHDPLKSPNLWVKSAASVFNDIGFLPVKYSATLKDSLFAENYTDEHSRTYLDNLNLLYVAMTRAEKGLMIFVPNSKSSFKKNYKNSVARILHESIIDSTELIEKWNAQTQSWSDGEINATKEKTISESNTISISAYTTSNWREKLIVKKTAPGLSNEDETARQKINFGIKLHAALSHVVVASDISKAIQQIQSDGNIHAEEKEMLEQTILKLMDQPQIANWFLPHWEVRNEAYALLPEGKEYRIDRLLTHGTQALVIDYKTGTATKKDQQQVADYCTMLNQMGYTSEGYLLYLPEGDVVSVVPPKVLKNKNKNQLGLDF